VLDVLERNGFRPHSSAELHDAMQLMQSVTPITPSQLRYLDLILPADRLKIRAILAAIRRQEAQATIAANIAAAARLGEIGMPVCQVIRIEGSDFVFRANVEGFSKTRLQLRAASIRNSNTDVINQPYGGSRDRATKSAAKQVFDFAA
jgi:hypothetical protein